MEECRRLRSGPRDAAQFSDRSSALDLYQKYRERGLEILAISVDEEVARYKVGRFVKEHELNFPVLYDNGVAERYKVNSYPTSLLIDREGTVRLRFNLAEKRSLDALVAELLK